MPAATKWGIAGTGKICHDFVAAILNAEDDGGSQHQVSSRLDTKLVVSFPMSFLYESDCGHCSQNSGEC